MRYQPEQRRPLPSALQRWLQPGHLAYFMVKVLAYAYATGVFCSRKIARKLHQDVAFRVLGASNFPAHHCGGWHVDQG